MAKGSKTPRFPVLCLNTAPWREKQGLSRAQLADRMGVSENSLRRYEIGEVNWDQEILQRAADALNVPLAAVLPQRPHSLVEVFAGVPADKEEAAIQMLQGLAKAVA